MPQRDHGPMVMEERRKEGRRGGHFVNCIRAYFMRCLLYVLRTLRMPILGMLFSANMEADFEPLLLVTGICCKTIWR